LKVADGMKNTPRLYGHLPLQVPVMALIFCSVSTFYAQDSAIAYGNRFTLHFQATTVTQFKPHFRAAYTGKHSQQPTEEWATTLTSTIFSGLRLWKNAAVFLNPEISGGNGLSSTFGIAAFPNGEAFRVGSPAPAIYLARLYFSQIIPLSANRIQDEDGENALLRKIPERYFEIVAGKISVADYFDGNTFSHNPRTQFMSWGLMSNGAWDYPANTRGYTPSIVLRYAGKRVEVKYAVSMLPVTANGNTMENDILKVNGNTAEFRYSYGPEHGGGKISFLLFYNTAFMGTYSASNVLLTEDSLQPGIFTSNYNIAASRNFGHSKYGAGINLEQNLSADIGLFARASWNDGKHETWCFTEIDRALSAGISMNGNLWHRKHDYAGVGYCISGLSQEHRNYLEAGGYGFMLGDGQLRYTPEHLFEVYYSATLLRSWFIPSVAYQFVLNPGYNSDRGPLSVISLRMHFAI
jgi:high affinity Mn2+ porin